MNRRQRKRAVGFVLASPLPTRNVTAIRNPVDRLGAELFTLTIVAVKRLGWTRFIRIPEVPVWTFRQMMLPVRPSSRTGDRQC